MYKDGRPLSDAITATVRQLADQMGAVSSEVVDLPATIAALVKYAAEREVDPYVIIGVLVEGIAHVVSVSIPAQQSIPATKEIACLLLNRLAARGLIS